MLHDLGLPPFVITTHGMYFHTRDLYLLKAFYLRTITRISLRKAHEAGQWGVVIRDEKGRLLARDTFTVER